MLIAADPRIRAGTLSDLFLVEGFNNPEKFSRMVSAQRRCECLHSAKEQLTTEDTEGTEKQLLTTETPFLLSRELSHSSC
jgi:hypothetical protein